MIPNQLIEKALKKEGFIGDSQLKNKLESLLIIFSLREVNRGKIRNITLDALLKKLRGLKAKGVWDKPPSPPKRKNAKVIPICFVGSRGNNPHSIAS